MVIYDYQFLLVLNDDIYVGNCLGKPHEMGSLVLTDLVVYEWDRFLAKEKSGHLMATVLIKIEIMCHHELHLIIEICYIACIFVYIYMYTHSIHFGHLIYIDMVIP